MQLLYHGQPLRAEAEIERWLEGGLVGLCDRYLASSVAYGEAQGLDPAWLAEIQQFLPQPTLTILLDIAPETAVRRKRSTAIATSATSRCWRACATAIAGRRRRPDWVRIDGDGRRTRRGDIATAVASRLALP